MAVILIDVLSAGLIATVSVFAGWWLRGGTRRAAPSTPASAPPQDADGEEQERARDALAKLHNLAERLAADVGEHNTRVQEINADLTVNESCESHVVVDAVSKLLQANENMQQQLASAESKLEEQAHIIDVHAKDARTDALTQLGNRRAFDIELANCEESFRTSGTPATLLITDVDRFKLFNDTHGHQAGDEVLRGVSRTMQNSVRAKDIVARYGGEEFAIIFPGTTVEQARTLAEHVRSNIEAATFEFEGTELKVTSSIGLAQLREGESADECVQRADEALYGSKEAGRNCGHWHDGTLIRPIVDPTPAETATAPVQESAAHEQSTDAEDQVDSRTDADTGLFNREALCEEIQRRVAEWRRGGSPVSVVFVEIDEFAGLVESTGESVGTLVLGATTQFLTAAVREMDLVARYDNQTFGMLLPGATAAEAIQVAKRLHRAISRCAIPHDDGEVKFTVSIGLAESLEGDDAELLRTRAETALKSAVDAGRDAAHYHDGTTTAPVDEVGSTVA